MGKILYENIYNNMGKIKGVSAWIFIIASIVFGIIIFTASASIIAKQIENANRQTIADNIADLYNTLKMVCINEGVGSQSYYEIDLPENVRAVYVSKSEYAEPPDKVSVLISNKESSVGNYFCYQLWDENLPKCRKLLCNLNFTYIGSPSLKNDLPTLISRIVGGTPVYKYRLRIRKLKDWFLIVEAKQIIKE